MHINWFEYTICFWTDIFSIFTVSIPTRNMSKAKMDAIFGSLPIAKILCKSEESASTSFIFFSFNSRIAFWMCFVVMLQSNNVRVNKILKLDFKYKNRALRLAIFARHKTSVFCIWPALLRDTNDFGENSLGSFITTYLKQNSYALRNSYFVIVSSDSIYSFQVGVLNNFQNGIFSSRMGTFSKNPTTASIKVWASGLGGSSRQPNRISKATFAKANKINRFSFAAFQKIHALSWIRHYIHSKDHLCISLR